MSSETTQPKPVIICVAPNGARKTKADHPNLPITPDELAATARSCLAAGAAMIHLHVRDDAGKHSLDVDRYKAAMTAITQAVGDEMIVQVTTEAVGIYSVDQQMAMVRDLKPEAVSLAVRELVPNEESEAGAADFFNWLVREKISPQFIVYDDADLIRFQVLQQKGIIPDNDPFLLYVLGRYAKDQQSTPDDLTPFLDVPGAREATWAFCAFGARENDCAIAAMKQGGHVRIGFENNMALPDGKTAPDNAALVFEVASKAEKCGRIIANSDSARRLLKIY